MAVRGRSEGLPVRRSPRSIILIFSIIIRPVEREKIKYLIGNSEFPPPNLHVTSPSSTVLARASGDSSAFRLHLSRSVERRVAHLNISLFPFNSSKGFFSFEDLEYHAPRRPTHIPTQHRRR